MTDHGKPFRQRLIGNPLPIDRVALAEALAKVFAFACFVGFVIVWHEARASEKELLEEATNTENALITCLNYKPVHMVPYEKKVAQQTKEGD